MIDVTVRLLEAFFNDPVHGINEMAQTLPRKTLDPMVDDPAPALVTVCSDLSDPDVAEKLEPAKVPAFMLFGDSAADITMRGYKVAKEVIVAGTFVTDETADSLTSSRDCGYILRGGLLTLGRYNSADKAGALRSLNGIKVLEISKVVEQRVTVAVGRRKMWGFLAIHATVVESLS
jgi:hypothetical protein